LIKSKFLLISEARKSQIFELQKTQSALPAARRREVQGAKRFCENRFIP